VYFFISVVLKKIPKKIHVRKIKGMGCVFLMTATTGGEPGVRLGVVFDVLRNNFVGCPIYEHSGFGSLGREVTDVFVWGVSLR
jgi:hypothetical protein